MDKIQRTLPRETASRFVEQDADLGAMKDRVKSLMADVRGERRAAIRSRGGGNDRSRCLRAPGVHGTYPIVASVSASGPS